MPISEQSETFTICKIEAGRAVLLSTTDFELIEFPAKLLPFNYKTGHEVSINVFNEKSSGGRDFVKLMGEVYEDFGVSEVEIERIREEIGGKGSSFLKLAALGSTAAIISWLRPVKAVLGPKITCHGIILNVEIDGGNARMEDYEAECIDFVLKGQQRLITPEDVTCRINLPIDLRVSLMICSSVGCFRSNWISLSCRKFEDFSGIFLLTDLKDAASLDRLEFIREQGGYIARQFNSDQPITAVVTDSFDSECFHVGIENNLPVVGASWLAALIATKELPHFEDHLLTK